MPHFEPCCMCGKIECSCLCGTHGVSPVSTPPIRTFETGATRDTDKDKLDYEGYLSPLVLRRFAQYMRKHQVQADGQMRKSDNWQKGIPEDVYMKSLLRHMMEVWLLHRTKKEEQEFIQTALCALLFNVQGYLFEVLNGKQERQCPQCGGPSTEKDILYYGCCVKCAHEPVGPSPLPKEQEEPGWDQGFWLCGKCGIKNKNCWRVCFNCQKEK
jgi:hypothetical protein